MLLADVCAEFVNVASADLDSKIENAQRVICEALGVDHSSVWQVSEGDPNAFLMTHAYRDPNLKPLPSHPVLKIYFPWSQRKILAKEIVCIPDAEDVPPEAATDKESWLQYDTHSALAFPLSVGGGEVIGLLTFDSTTKREWSESLQRRLQILAFVFAQALDRKNSEQKVRESENRFRLVADTAPVLIWMSGTDKLYTYFNKPWLDFTGRTVEQEIGNGWAEGVHLEDSQRCLDTYTQAFDRREKFAMEYRLWRHDGQYRWMFDIGVPRFNQEGSFAGYIGSCIDVTERRRAEEARFRHAAILESSEDAIISKNLAAVITSWNAGAERMFGYTESEAVGQPITILIPPELHEEEDQILDKLRAGGRIEHYETTRATKTGKPIAVSLTISPIKDSTGKVVGFCKLAHDITDRKRAEQALQETNRSLEIQTSALRSQEELLKIFVKNVPAAVAMLDRDMRYVQVSDRWCTDYLPGRAQILGRSHYEIFPDLPERWKEVHRRALQGETLRADEDSWDGRDGTHWARWEVRPWKTREGAVGGILILAEDIGRRKQMEEALSGMSRKLIESQEQERTRIGRELHDDINQRLAMLAVELEQLQENPSEVSNRVQGVRKEITEISNDVQALSHELHSSKLEYLGVVAGIKSWCKEFSERQRMEVNVENEVFSTLPFEVGLSLFRVIQEALHNAQKHSGVKRIEVQLREDSGEIHLIIRDSGKGFDIDAALQGRGLGLTSMRERVRLVNGTIAIESKPMGGTSIHVRVPLESKNSSQRAAG